MRPAASKTQPLSATDKLRQALEMYDDGVAMMRLRLARAFGPQQAEIRLQAWLRGDLDATSAQSQADAPQGEPSAR